MIADLRRMSFLYIRSGPVSVWALFFVAFVLVCFRCLVVPDHQLGWDVFGYYLYLPSIFIYEDPLFLEPGWLDHLMSTYKPSATLYQLVDLDNGARVIKYSMGNAFFMFPFFFIANLVALLTGYPVDGLSLPYQLIVTAGGMFYALIGLVYMRRILLHYFKDRFSALLLLLLVFGTNYFQLIAFDGTLLTHNFLFTLFAFLLWQTIKWHEAPNTRRAALIGASIGLIILVRPSEMPALLIPLLYGIYDKNSLKAKLELLRRNSHQVAIAVFCTLLAGSPQVIYWKYVTGSYLFYSYKNAGEGFEFLSPYLYQFLFSFRKGWFIYTPLMLIAVFGFAKMRTYAKELTIAAVACFLASLWIMSSWTTWWYAGGSFSSRSMLSIYPLLLIALGFILKDHWKRRNMSKYIVGSILMLLVILNLFQTWQWRAGLIDRERMTSAAYFAILGRTEAPPGYDRLLLVERSTDGKDRFADSSYYEISTVYSRSFIDSLEAPKGLILDHNTPFSPGMSAAFNELTDQDHIWITATAQLTIPENYQGGSPSLVAAMHHEGGSYKYVNKHLEDKERSRGGEVQIGLSYLTPEVRDPADVLKVYVWQADSTPILLRSLHVEMREPRSPVPIE